MTRNEGQLTPKTDDGFIVDERGRRWVTMSNGLTRAAHGLTLGEKRLVALAITKLDSRKGANDGLKTRIHASEYAETFGVDENTAYEQLQAAGKALYKRSIVFYTPAYKRNGTPLEPTEHRMRWVGRSSYAKGEGWIELAWWHEVLPHITGLAKQFTRYQLEQASALRSTYSWKLLELLMRFKDTGWAQYTIEDFCASMEATKAMQANFAKIRTKIIEPAVTELTEKDGWEIEWQPVKGGRRVKALKFQFRRNPQGRLDL
jgi:plasmid replication initiation protein